MTEQDIICEACKTQKLHTECNHSYNHDTCEGEPMLCSCGKKYCKRHTNTFAHFYAGHQLDHPITGSIKFKQNEVK